MLFVASAIRRSTVTITGEIFGGFILSHNMYCERFYSTKVQVRRLSGVYDIISLMVSEHLIDVGRDYTGQQVEVTGQFRSYNRHAAKKSRLELSVFAKEILFLDNNEEGTCNNRIYLDGFICRDPIYRTTPRGREIADILLAVNRPYSKADYIPCVFWGRMARRAEELMVGARCIVKGRIQSREYIKKLAADQLLKKVAYEVSVIELEVLKLMGK